jgi:formate dehydrogenase gamma subunit
MTTPFASERTAVRTTVASAAGAYAVRFSVWQRVQHALILVLFVLLLVTGLPQKWPYAEWSRWTLEAVGGVWAARWLHRIAGVVFTVLTVVHIAWVSWTLLTRRTKPSMLITRKDFTDAVETLQYYLGHRERQPSYPRFDYKQKFEYWGLIFGSLIMAFTGLVLYFPILFSTVLPAELIPAAKVMHSNEAMLAFLIIIVWHIWGVLFSPEVFPLDTSIFTGKISKERLKHEHGLEYEEKFGKG